MPFFLKEMPTATAPAGQSQAASNRRAPESPVAAKFKGDNRMIRTKNQWLRLAAASVIVVAALAGGSEGGAPGGGDVSVSDSGSQIHPATYECTHGHKFETRLIHLDSGAVRYGFRYAGCLDPSHGDQRLAAEGNFGMPEPTSANWYWGGFLFLSVNGKEATRCPLADLRVIERGPRGAFQILWTHPEADVGLRLMLLPGANHVMVQLVWKPKPQAAIHSVSARLVCYPSFFTAPHHRRGDRHCRTPRIDKHEPETLKLLPDADTCLYYYDTIFDVAKGEGDGPCAALVAPGALQGGLVRIGDYAVTTELTLKPEAGQARLAFYDFTGHTNADAEGYLQAHARSDLAELISADFRPQAVRELQAERLRAEASRLLAAAADDAQPYRAQVNQFLARVAVLAPPAKQGDWKAEADLASVLAESSDLFWKLRAIAVLNNSR
jgi:hypothetical protein